MIVKASKMKYIEVRNYSDILEVDKGKNSGPQMYLFIDGVTDPQNFGSILRSAMFLGANGIIVNRQDCCGLTPAVSKVSSGALEFLNMYQVKFVQKFLMDIKSKHNFAIISSKLDEDSVSLSDLKLNKD